MTYFDTITVLDDKVYEMLVKLKVRSMHTFTINIFEFLVLCHKPERHAKSPE